MRQLVSKLSHCIFKDVMENLLSQTNFRRHILRYNLLVLGFLLKEIGALMDVSYHFKHFRDFYQLPHIINGAGDALVVALLWHLWRNEPEARHEQLKILWYGLLIFAFGIFFGVLSVALITTPFPFHPPIPVVQTMEFGIPAAIIGYAIALLAYQKLFHRYI